MWLQERSGWLVDWCQAEGLEHWKDLGGVTAEVFGHGLENGFTYVLPVFVIWQVYFAKTLWLYSEGPFLPN